VRKTIYWVPGCGTLTECTKALTYGTDIIKIFPGNVLGPGFVKALLGPMPRLKLIPTGGVKPTEKSLNEWFKAGVICVGMGSQLISNEVLKNSDFHKLEADVKNAFMFILLRELDFHYLFYELILLNCFIHGFKIIVKRNHSWHY
jgi:2-dehydro-3-deoxyphosphogluconate aldolase/(4S)-4-hydroxy-2-oxoglutarate aldolase